MPAKPKAPNAATIMADESTAHVVALLRLDATYRTEALDLLKDLERELVAAVEDSKPSERTRAMLAQTSAIIEAAYKTMTKAQVKNLEGVAMLEGKAVANMQNRAVGVNIFKPAIATPLLAQLVQRPIVLGNSGAQPVANWWNGQSEDLKRRFSGQMQLGAMRSETVPQLIDRIRGTAARGFTDGVMQASKTQAETLVRTSIQSISNAARLATFEAQPELIKAIEWVSTLDSRTSDICKALDGCTWTLPDYKPEKGDKVFPGPVAHYRCRSTQVPVTKSWAELSGKKIPTLDNATLQQAIDKKLTEAGKTPEQIQAALANARASMDGQVSAETDFNGFVKRKGAAFANEVLGDGRAQLWTAGQITMRDLTDQQNRPLTLAELQRAVDKGIVPPETAGRRVQPTPPPKAPPKAPPPEPEQVAAISQAASTLTLDDLRRQGLPTTQADLDIVRMAHAVVGGDDAPPVMPGDAARIAAMNPDQRALFNAAKAKRVDQVDAATARQNNTWMADSLAKPIPPRKSPVSAAVSTPAARLQPILKHALDNIDRVIDDGGLPPIQVKGDPRGKSNGLYEFRNEQPVQILLNLAARTGGRGLPATAVHEVGHYIHHQFFGLQFSDHWDQGKPTAPFFKAVAETHTHKLLLEAVQRSKGRDDPPAEQVRYLADPREVFTRAFTQWIAEESGDALLLNELRHDRASMYGGLMHWPPGEMAILAEEFRKLFSKTYRKP